MPNSEESARLIEDAVVRRLRGERLISTGARRGPSFAIGASLLAGLAIFSFLQPAGREPPAEGTYMLALYGGPGYRAELPGGPGRAAEYGAWARSHSRREAGAASVIGGEELARPVATLGGAAPELLGYFTIRAENEQQAVRLARTAPHLRYGGSVVVQQIGS